jgi:hypothetical protein
LRSIFIKKPKIFKHSCNAGPIGPSLNPFDKVRAGHLPAAGALIGAVMKETKGQADAAKVRSLLLSHLGQNEG